MAPFSSGAGYFSRPTKSRAAKRRRGQKRRLSLMQQLEDRRLLAVLSDPTHVLPTVENPVAIGVGTFGGDAAPDAILLGSGGDLTVAHRSPDDNRWETIQTIDTLLGPQQTMVAQRLNADPQTDLVLQSAEAISVLHNDLQGGFSVVQTLSAPDSSEFSVGGFTSTGQNTMLVDFIDTDLSRDLVVVASASDAVLVYPGLAGGTFASPQTYFTGVASPTTAIAADVIGDGLPDLVVGHADGSIVFFEGVIGSGSLLRRDDLTTVENASIVGFGKADFDSDGNTDLAVTTATESFLLFSSDDPRDASVIVNGDFSAGLSGWQTEVVGTAADAAPGRINALGGAAQFTENESFLTSLQQTIVIPEGATSLSFDFVALALDPVAGGVPDAFEVSLLDADQKSVVPTHIAHSTAFFNHSSGSAASVADGVTVSGSTVTLDVTGLIAGQNAKLVFDLIGNPPGNRSIATIDNVAISPDLIFSDELNRITLPGNLSAAVDMAIGDVDGNGAPDIVLVDAGTDALTIYNADGHRNFVSQSISLSGFGSAVSAIATAPLTTGDSVDDIIVTLADSNLALSPIRTGVTDPIVSLAALENLVTDEGRSVTVSTTFEDPGQVGNYSATIDWGDGVSNEMTITAEADGFSGLIAADHIYADNNRYDITVTMIDGNGTSVSTRSVATVANTPPVLSELAQITAVTNRLTRFDGLALVTDAGFTTGSTEETLTATIDWGDGSPVTTIDDLDESIAGPEGPTTATIGASHLYASQGVFDVTVTVADDDGGVVDGTLQITVEDEEAVRGACLPVIDFENGITGAPLATGEIIDDQWALWGVHITTHDPIRHPAMIFDSALPTGGDSDLGSPHIDFGGSGVGSGGRAGKAGENSQSHGRVLIISEDSDSSDPDDNASGGRLIFRFDHPVQLDEISLLDIDARENTVVRLFDAAGDLIDSVPAISGGDNAFETMTLDAANVSRMEVDFAGSGAVTDLVFCRDLPRVQILGDSNVAEGNIYTATLSSPHTDPTSWTLGLHSPAGMLATQTLDGDSLEFASVLPDGDLEYRISGWATDGVNVYPAEDLLVTAINVDPVLSIAGEATVESQTTYSLDLVSVDPGADTITHWQIDWGDGLVETVSGDSDHATHRYSAIGQHTIQATAFDEDNSAGYLSNLLDVSVTQSSSAWLPNVDFNVDGFGIPMPAGTILSDQFASIGFTVSSADASRPAMIFDSSAPTGGDSDLGSPARRYGGPGVGSGGASNSVSHENVLIISEDGDTSDPDDNARGGTLVFDFEQPVMIDELGMLDVQSGDNHVDLFDHSGTLIASTSIANSGNNGYSRVVLDAVGVSRMEVHLAGSGAITDIEFCRDAGFIAPVSTRFFVTDASDRVERYDTVGSSLSGFDVTRSINARGVTTNQDGNPIWVISEEGSRERVYVYDSDGETLLGDWTARGLSAPEGIATDGTDIWIVDDGTNTVKRYAGAAGRLSGAQSAKSGFRLAYGNRHPRGITTDGQTLWVVDGVSHKVFAYEMDGAFLNWWNIDPDNTSPTGITINPAGGDGVWIVDDASDSVYHYANATLPYQGDQRASGLFPLAAGNTSPTGIADPATIIHVGDAVSGTLTEAGQVDEYEFTKSFRPVFLQVDDVSGGQIRLNYDSSSGDPATALFGPGQVTELTYFGPGTFSFSVSVGSGTPTYDVSLLEPPPPSFASINQGDTVTDSIDAAYATDLWSFIGAAGQAISIDVAVDIPGLVLEIVDTSASGGLNHSPLFSGPFSDTGSIALPSTGGYEVSIFSPTAWTGAYEFTVNAAPLPSITLGTAVTGQIQASGAVDAYTLSGIAGQSLNFDVVTAGPFTFSLFGPSGQTIFSDLMADYSGVPIDQNEVTLPTTGDYTVTVDSDDGEGFSTGPYEFIVTDQLIASTTINLGDRVRSDLASENEIDRYVFTIAPDQAIELDFTEITGGPLETMITDTSGVIVNHAVSALADDHDFGPQITVPGTYTLQLSGSGSSTAYDFTLLEAIYTTTQLVDGDTVAGEIASAAELDVYSFVAGVGDRINVDFSSVSAELTSELVAPDGSVIRRETSDRPFEHRVFDLETTQSGTYTFQISAGGGQTPSYSFQYTRAALQPPVTIELGQSIEETFDVHRSVNQYTFEANSGDAFFVNYNDLTGGTIATRVLDPDGQELFSRVSSTTDSHDSGRILAPKDGTYTIRVGAVDEDLASYQFRLDVAPETKQSIELGALYFGEIISPGSINTYDFTAESGDSLYLDLVSLSDQVGIREDFNDLQATLIGPSGEVVQETDFRAEVRPTGVATNLTESGLYRLVIAGSGDDLLQYEFQLNDVTPAPAVAIELGQLVSDSIDVAGETLSYLFPAVVGAELTLDVLLNEIYLAVPSFEFSIIGPSGNVEVERVEEHTTFTVMETGQYQIRVDNRETSPSDLNGDFSFRLLSDPATAIPSPADLIVSAVTVDPISVGNPAAVQVNWTVTNIGTATAQSWNANPWFDRVIVSNDNDSPDVRQRVFAEVPHSAPLAAGESYTATATIALPPDIEGAFWAFVETNATNRVYEGQNSNNNTRRADSLTAIFPAQRVDSAGPAIEVSPPDGSVYPTGTELTLSGKAGRSNQSINAVFVVDVSRSTRDVTGLDVNGDGVGDAGDDLNGDSSIGDILDAEIGAAIRLTEHLQLRSDDIRVSTVLFAGSSTIMDAGPERFNQFFADPAADTTYFGELANFQTALRNLTDDETRVFRPDTVTNGTSFTPPILNVNELLAAAQPADRTLVYFLTDGQAFDPDPIPLAGVADQGIEFYAFQLGGESVTAELDDLANSIDADPSSSGRAIAVSSIDQLSNHLLSTIDVQSVTVNGIPVTAIDPAGNFFTPVSLAAGANPFTVVATTTVGTSSETNLTLFGEDAAPVLELDSLEPAVPGLQARYSGTTFNRTSNQLHTTLAVDNQSMESVSAPLVATFTDLDPASIKVLDADGDTTAGAPYVVLDSEMDPLLLAGAVGGATALTFSNPNRSRFSMQVQFETTGNSAPVFTGVPVLAAEVGQLYSYNVGHFDHEADVITTRLIEGPPEMSLSENQLTWMPAAVDVGHHRVVVEISDSRGGNATQEFTLLVPSGLPNHPPLILSTPQRVATINQPFVYDILAVDPERSSVTLSIESPSPAGASVSGTRLTWTPESSQIGQHSITILATDTDGLIARQSFDLEVRAVNSAPTFTTTPVTEVLAGEPYFYPAVAVDSDDQVAYSVDGPTGITVDARTGRVDWPRAFVVSGSYPITLTATDERGLASEQDYTLTVSSDNQPPLVDIASTTNLLNLGETARITVFARDNVELAGVSLSIDGIDVPIDSESGFDYVAENPGIKEVVFTAIDAAGNVATIELDPFLRVIDPSDTTAPIIEITSPLPGDVVTYLTDIVGTVTDDNLEYYEVQVALSGTNEYRPVSRNTFRPDPGGIGVVSDVLGVFDPTLLANDFYDIRIVAQDTNGNISKRTTSLSVEGAAKLGNFRIELTDATIPVAGIPIQINRIYDTLDAPYDGDFGYGWRLDVASPRIRESVPVSESEAAGAGIFGANPFKIGTRVYMNLPDGRRVGFTFDPIPEPQLLETLWRPRFVPDPGVFHRLEVDKVSLQQNADGTFGLYLLGFPYNPDTYTLVTNDQLRYTYNQFAEIELQSIEDRNNVVLTFDQSGIHSSAGPGITWDRNEFGRITQIIDTAGNPLTYTYSPSGELVGVTNQVGDTLSMTYLSDPAHYLETITDPRGITVATNQFDEEGRLTGETDGRGNTAPRQYDVAGNLEILGDRLGNETVLIFDDRGNTLQMTDPLGNRTLMEYDAHDNLISYTDREGYETTVTYDDRGNVLSVTDAMGGVKTIQYDDRNGITQVTDPLGRVTQFTFDANGNLASTINAGGDVTSVTRDTLGRQLSFTDQFGLVTQFEYDTATLVANRVIWPDGTSRQYDVNAMGMITQTTDERGNVNRFVSDEAGRRTEMIDAEGGSIRIGYTDGLLTSMTNQADFVTGYRYDANGQVIAHIDASGNTMQYIRDAEGRVVETLDPEGRRVFTTYDAIGNVTEQTINPTYNYKYNPRGQVVQEISATGAVTQYTYDALGRVETVTSPEGRAQTYVYDAVGNVVELIDGLGTTTFEYDFFDQVTEIVDPLGISQRWTYDQVGNVTSFTDGQDNTWAFGINPAKRSAVPTSSLVPMVQFSGGRNDQLVDVTDPLGNTTTFDYDAAGNLISEVDALGRVYRFEYDTRNQLTKVIDPTDHFTSFDYDAVGNQIRFTDKHGNATEYAYDPTGNLSQVTDALGQVSSYSFDGNGNLTALVDQAGSATTYTYDNLDRLTQVENALGHSILYEYDADSNLLRYTDQQGNQWKFAYDLDRLMTQAEMPDGGTYRYTYDEVGLRTEEADPLGRIRQYEYDAASRLTKEIDPDGFEILYTYDDRHLLTSFTDGAGNVRRYDYDKIGRLVRDTDALDASTIYQYDAVDNLTAVLDRLGRRIEYSYDSLDRMTEERWVGSPDNRSIGFSYDATGNLLTAGDVNSHYQYQYDALNRVISDDNLGTPNVPRNHLTYGFDSRGNLETIRDQSGTQVQLVFDSINRPVEISWDGGGVSPVLVEMDYNVRDGLSQIRRYTNAGTPILVGLSNYTFDTSGRMTRVEHLWASGDEISAVDYGYNLASELISTTDRGVFRQYDRDGRGQVTAVADASGILEEYVFDGAGNRTSDDDQVSTGNRLESDGDYDYQYDAVGNLIGKTRITDGQVTEYTYDYRNRLTSVVVTADDGVVETQTHFVYDVFDRKIIREVDGVVQTTVYDGSRVWADHQADGTVIAKYLYGTEAIDHLIARDRPGEGTAWYLQDRLFSVRDVVDSAGNVLDSIDYDSFGNISSESDPAAGDRFKFTGREWEASIGLYDYRARHYDPTTGRFSSEDSWGISAGDTNFYRYVGNSPTDFIDPSGHIAASTYASVVSSVIFSIIDVDFSCFTESTTVFSVGAGVPFTDIYQEFYSRGIEGGGIPTPAAVDVQIMSCALLGVAAWSNGVFAEFSTVLSLLSQSQSDPPRGCTNYHDVQSLNFITDYSVTVRASCGGDGPPYYVVNNDNRFQINTGFGGSPHSNCFIAGTHVLVVDDNLSSSKLFSNDLSDSHLAVSDWTPLIVGLVGLATTLGIAKSSQKLRSLTAAQTATDEFWSQFEPESPEMAEPLDDELIEDTLRRRPIQTVQLAAEINDVQRLRSSVHSPAVTLDSDADLRRNTTTFGQLARWGLAVILMIACTLPLLSVQPSIRLGPDSIADMTFETSVASKPIESIVPGDTVLAWDEAFQREMPRTVLRVFRNSADHIHRITITSSDGRRQTIGTTCTHPFWVIGSGWTDASTLQVGDQLQEPGGRVSQVSGHETEFSEDGIATYNFEVEGSHTYFAAASSQADAVLVHNTSKRPRRVGRLKQRISSGLKRTLGRRAKTPQCGVPKKLTAKEVKNARQRGVYAAKAAERKLIQDGHPGTANQGGFTWPERKQIAETGQYPSDVRWHHINDVKRNPTLADVPNNVVPSRGGAAGHVNNFHQNGGTQGGSSGQMLDREGLSQQHLNGGG
ncbi:polymorphic toxin-type HINT domain-containing protein [Stieleria sp. TO1_6]|uniref:RHS repeat-associated core domain-containing protein n=1 Tax=Stieleria tagensis TaxID=2956795 RepID=UPI00209B68A2|nr:RHS repeat-associated core domain-containing protein [Stieleria tagensis]MCO8125241.1 polymorphic toxin-type HINT domain-containing protein [Stieleria tagensis]